MEEYVTNPQGKKIEVPQNTLRQRELYNQSLADRMRLLKVHLNSELRTTSDKYQKEQQPMKEKLGKQDVEVEVLKRKISALQQKLERVHQDGINAHTIHEQKIQEVNSREDKQLEMLEQNTALIRKVQTNMESFQNSQDMLAELLANLDEGVHH